VTDEVCQIERGAESCIVIRLQCVWSAFAARAPRMSELTPNAGRFLRLQWILMIELRNEELQEKLVFERAANLRSRRRQSIRSAGRRCTRCTRTLRYAL